MKQIIFILVLALGLEAHATMTCENLFFKKNQQTMDAANDNLSPSYVTQLHAAELVLWSGMLGDLGEDIHVTLRLSPEQSVHQSVFDSVKNEILLGYKIPTMNPVHRSVILAHEFGHAVFQQHFSFSLGETRVSYQDVVDMGKKDLAFIREDQAYQDLAREIMEIEKTVTMAKQVGHQELISDLTHLLQTKNDEQSAMTPRWNSFLALRSFLIPYNELFADSLPVLIWKNPRAITEALHDPKETYLEAVQRFLLYGGKNRRHIDEARTFKIIPFKDWQTEIASAYTLLDPARGVLWNLFIKNLEVADIPTYMKTHLQATEEHMNLRFKRGEDPENEKTYASPTQLNQEFVRIFVRLAKKNGLKISKS